jgi:Zinc finger, C2H2 type
MVLHECPKCSYSTSDPSNFNRHVKKCDPEKPPPNRKKEHKCDACGIVFAQKSGLWKHNKRFHSIEAQPPSGAQMSNMTIINNPVNCVFNITKIFQVNSFQNTNTAVVVQESLRSPARVQVANKKGILEELLIHDTWYNPERPENHNINSIEGHGTNMTVMAINA